MPVAKNKGMKTAERMRLEALYVVSRGELVWVGQMRTYSVVSGRPPGASENIKVDILLVGRTRAGGVSRNRSMMAGVVSVLGETQEAGALTHRP